MIEKKHIQTANVTIDKLISVGDYSKTVTDSIATIYNKINRGDIKTVTIGKQKFIIKE